MNRKTTSRDVTILERRFVPKGTLVVREGDDGASAFLIQSGKVRVFTGKDGKIIDLAVLETGQIFGEMALVFDEKRTASVEVVEDCNLIVITRQALDEKLKSSEPMVRAIIKMLSMRIIQSNNALLERLDTLEDLMSIVNTVFQNVRSALPDDKRITFDDEVAPALKSFHTAIDRFSKETPKEAKKD
jgi:CRP-like cAMP-binding protein